MKKPPAFQFYAKDFLSATALFSAVEVGAYIRLLAWSWDNGSLPKNDEQITRIAGVDLAVWSAISHKWIESETGWTNQRLEVARRKQKSYLKLQAENGRKRWQSHGIAEPQPEPSRKQAEPIPSDLRSASAISNLQVDQEQREDAPDVHRVLVRLAHEVIKAVSPDAEEPSETELGNRLKDLAAEKRIPWRYTHEIEKAMASALVQHRQRQRRSA